MRFSIHSILGMEMWPSRREGHISLSSFNWYFKDISPLHQLSCQTLWSGTLQLHTGEDFTQLIEIWGVSSESCLPGVIWWLIWWQSLSVLLWERFRRLVSEKDKADFFKGIYSWNKQIYFDWKVNTVLLHYTACNAMIWISKWVSCSKYLN